MLCYAMMIREGCVSGNAGKNERKLRIEEHLRLGESMKEICVIVNFAQNTL